MENYDPIPLWRPANIIDISEEHTIAAALVEISQTGAVVSVTDNVALEPGSLLKLEFSLPLENGLAEFLCHVEVMHSYPQEDQGFYINMTFLLMSKDTSEQLNTFLDQKNDPLH